MSQAKFPFDRQFQIGILSLCVQRYDFLLTAVEIIKDEYFEDQVLIWFFQTIRNHYLQNQDQPTPHPVISNELKKATRAGRIKPNQIQDYSAVFNQLGDRVNSQHYVVNEIVRFCRRQAGRRAFLECAPRMDTADDQDWDEIIDQVVNASQVGTNYLDVGTHWYADAAERDRLRRVGDDKEARGGCGIPIVDTWLGGGLKDGQLGIFMGGTGGGKSIALPQVGRHAMTLGYRVAHYTLELNEREVGARYDAAMTQIPFQDLKSSSHIFRKKMAKMGRYDGKLVIKDYPTGSASTNTIKSHLKQLESFDWYPDVIIVDYGDLLKPLTKYDNEYADLGAIFRDLRGIAGENNCPLWTATQVNRPGLGAEIVDVEHISDSLKKAQIADVIVALAATPEERQRSLLRLYLAKNRNGPAKCQTRIFSAFEKMVLYTQLKGVPPECGEDISHLPSAATVAAAAGLPAQAAAPPAATAATVAATATPVTVRKQRRAAKTT